MPDKSFWNERWKTESTGWDVGEISTPIKTYIDQIQEKNVKILIPGAGNAYEAEYLVEQGFNNVTVIDIAPVLVEKLKNKFKNQPIKILEGDFFALSDTFDLVIEQTFFCALDPSLRPKYVEKMYEILNQSGKIVGVLFDCEFDGGPPFGGNREKYKQLFEKKFKIQKLETCYNSISPRMGNEAWIKFLKKQ